MSYRCLSQKSFRIEDYTIVPIRHDDMMAIKEWRNAQIDFLRQPSPLTDQQQEQYWKDIIVPSFEEECPNQILFSYLKRGELIGYGGLTYIDWRSRRAEVSFLLDPKMVEQPSVYQEDHAHFLQLVKECAFKSLGFHRLFTETFNIRPLHVETLEKEGFKFEGTLKDHVKIGDHYCDSLIHGLINEELP